MDLELADGKIRWLKFLLSRKSNKNINAAIEKERSMEIENPSFNGTIQLLLKRPEVS